MESYTPHQQHPTIPEPHPIPAEVREAAGNVRCTLTFCHSTGPECVPTDHGDPPGMHIVRYALACTRHLITRAQLADAKAITIPPIGEGARFTGTEIVPTIKDLT